MNKKNVKLTMTTDEDKKKADYRLEREATFIIDHGNRLLETAKEVNINLPVITTTTVPVHALTGSVPHSLKYNKQPLRTNSLSRLQSKCTYIPHPVIASHKVKSFRTNTKPLDTAKVKCKTSQQQFSRTSKIKTNENDESNRMKSTNTSTEEVS